jgi:hypothetical protein
MVALLNLGPFALGRASESVAGIAMFLKLPVRELDIAVLHEAVQAEGVFVGTVEHNHSVFDVEARGALNSDRVLPHHVQGYTLLVSVGRVTTALEEELSISCTASVCVALSLELLGSENIIPPSWTSLKDEGSSLARGTPHSQLAWRHGLARLLTEHKEAVF